MENQSNKPINYFLVTVQIIKNGKDIIIEKYGIKGKESTSEHGHTKLKDNIKAMRKRNYPNDSFAITIILSEPTTKEQYESLAVYAQH